EGVFSTDPRVVPAARKIDVLSYEEMLELASLGARVLHPRAVEIAKKFGVVLHVRSSFTPNPGTLIKEVDGMEIGRLVTGVAFTDDIAKVTLLGVPDQPGVAARLFSGLAGHEV